MSSTEITTIPAGGIAALQRDPQEILEILEENLGGSKLEQKHLPRVKIPSGGGTTWEIPNEAPTKELTGILVAFKANQRAYWKSEDLSNQPPDCRSDGGVTGIGNPGGDCDTCPFAQFGSKGDGQACSQSEVWFLLRPGLFLPLVLKLPATSITAAEGYRMGDLGTSLLRPTSVLTSIKLKATKDKRGNPYSIAEISRVGNLSPDEAKAAREYALAMAPLFEGAARDIVASKDRGPVPASADVVADAEAEADEIAEAHAKAEAAAEAARAESTGGDTDSMFDPQAA